MASYWERRLQQNRQRSLQAQADRYSAQVPAAVRDAQERRRVEQAERQRAQARVAQARREREERQRREAELAQQRAQADARVAQAQREREARELEAAQRAQAEARVNFAQSRREAAAAAAAERLSPTESLFGEPVVPPSDTQEFFEERVEQRRRQAEMAPFWREIAFGPERGSVVGGDASELERFLRDWGLAEQEFSEGFGRLGEGRVLSGAGFLGLGALGLGANIGDLRRFALRAGRASRLLPGAARAGEMAGDAAGAVPTPRRREIPSDEDLAARAQRSREAAERRAREERALEQVRESEEFNRRQEALRRQQEIEFNTEQQLRYVPQGPRRVTPEGVRALDPITPSTRITSDPIRAGVDDLLSRGLIRPVFKDSGSIAADLERLGANAFPNVAPERIAEAARIAAQTPQVRYGRGLESFQYTPGSQYGIAGAADRINDLRLVEKMGEILDVTPQRGSVLPKNLPAVASRFGELEPAVAVRRETLEQILSGGRFRTPAEVGSSRSLAMMSPGDRLRLVERGMFGVREGYVTQPIYGFLVGQRGSRAQPWELRNEATSDVLRTGRNVTSERAGSTYGSVVIRFNDNVRQNTSFSFGDSIKSPHGVGRPLASANETDVALAGVHAAPDSPYIEAQIWQAPRVEDIASITAPEGLHNEIRAMLRANGLDVPVYGYADDTVAATERAADVGRATSATEAWGNIVSPQTRALAETELRSVSVGDSALIPTISSDGKPRLQPVTRSETAMPADSSTVVPFTPDARLRPLVRTGEEVAPSHVYRVMSREEFELARERGFIQSAGAQNLVEGEGTVFSLRPTGEFYAPGSGEGVIVRVRYDDADGWFVGPEGPSYVKTQSEIPFDRVDAFEEFGG